MIEVGKFGERCHYVAAEPAYPHHRQLKLLMAGFHTSEVNKLLNERIESLGIGAHESDISFYIVIAAGIIENALTRTVD